MITERSGCRSDARLPAPLRTRVHGGSNDVDKRAVESAMRIVDDAWLSTTAR